MFKRMADRRIEDHQYSVHIAHYYLYASFTQAVELLLNYIKQISWLRSCARISDLTQFYIFIFEMKIKRSNEKFSNKIYRLGRY